MSTEDKTVENLIKEMNGDVWNPLGYCSGPGEALAKALGNLEKKDVERKPYLVLKNFESGLIPDTIRSILRNVVIHSIRRFTNLFFIEFNSVADLEESLRILEKSKLDLKIEIGQHKTKVEFTTPLQSNESPRNGHFMAPNSIDMESRTIKISSKNPMHPTFKRMPLIDPLEYKTENSLIARNDLKGRYAFATYEHVLERTNIFQLAKVPIDDISQYEYRAGRSTLSFVENMENVFPKTNGSDILQPIAQEVVLKGFKFVPCCSCGQLCNIHCLYCLSPFCGVACQKKLNVEHTLACSSNIKLRFNPPTLEQNNKITIWEDHMPASGSKVVITAFQRTNVVCVRLISNRDDNAYFGIIEQVNSEGKESEKLTNLPKCGELVLLQLEDEYLRAMILKVEHSNAITLVCIDYGNVEVQPLDKLFVMNKRLAELPRYAIPVELKGVPNRFLRLQCRKLLYSYLNSHKLKIKYSSADCVLSTGFFSVELFDDVLHMSLNKCLTSLVTPIEPNLSDELYLKGSLEEAPLPLGANVELLIMDNSLIKYGFVSCTTKEFALEIEKYQEDIQVYGNSTKKGCYAPQPNELCIAKYEPDGQWCRGNCLERVGDGFPTIHFLDYGNISVVSVEQIRRYPVMFVYPILTIDVEITDMPTECDDGLIAQIENHFTIGKIITADLKFNSNENVYYLKNPKC